jgi:hypothetical protein
MRKVELEDVDRTKLENLQLRGRNLELEMLQLRNQSTALAKKRDDLLVEMQVVRKSFQEKYQIDLGTEMVNDQGYVVPNPVPLVDPQVK